MYVPALSPSASKNCILRDVKPDNVLVDRCQEVKEDGSVCASFEARVAFGFGQGYLNKY